MDEITSLLVGPTGSRSLAKKGRPNNLSLSYLTGDLFAVPERRKKGGRFKFKVMQNCRSADGQMSAQLLCT